MPQVSKHFLSAKIQEKITHIFLETIVRLKNKNQAERLLSDLLTPTEKIMLAKRLSIAYLLEKEIDYRTISQTLKVSLTTIARISNTRKVSGEEYRNILKQMIKEEDIQQFFSEIDYKLSTILPPKGKNWNQWRKNLEKSKRQNQPAF